jgi:phosphoserine phosphatase
MEKKLIIFDVCGTLYDSNTTFDFIKFFRRDSIYIKLLGWRPIKLLLVALGKVISLDIYRSLFIYSLKGIERTTLIEAANDFYEHVLQYKKIDVTHQLLERSKQQIGVDVLYCSASLDIIVQVISERLGGRYQASSLSFSSDGICSGFLSNDLLGKKDVSFKDMDIELTVTDNISDLALLKISKNSFVLSKKKHISFWQENGFTVDLVIK